MVQETKRFLSYICPHCAQSVIVERDLFSLAAAPAHIKCPCGKSELLVEFKPNRVQLTVPCLFCGREHTVSCSSHAFIREKALAFSCAASGLDCCYVGEERPVYAATARLEQAVDKLGVRPDILLNDAVVIPGLHMEQVPIVKGDAKSVSIAAASILAKVTRDRMMIQYDSLYPEYGFGKHKGYGTAANIEALREYGPCPIHRRTFLKRL